MFTCLVYVAGSIPEGIGVVGRGGGGGGGGGVGGGGRGRHPQ